MDKICGIYKITSPTGKIYIGQSVDIENRKGRYNKLECNRQPKLYNSFVKYGFDAHKFEIIHECTEPELNELEKYYIKLFNTFDTKYGLNLTSGGDHTTLSEETRNKISESNKGKKLTEKHKLIIGESKRGNKYWVGRKHSDETKEKLRIINTGKKLSEEHKQKISVGGKGRIVSDETKLKQSLARKGRLSPNIGRKHTEESKIKMSVAQKGRIVSEEAKKKMSLAKKGKPSPIKGKKLSEETKKKISLARKGKKTIFNTYEIYNQNNELIYKIIDNFICETRRLKLPSYSFIRSYQENCKINRGKYINWYAIKL